MRFRPALHRAACISSMVALTAAGLVAGPPRDVRLVRHSAPEALAFDELVKLSSVARPTGELGERLVRLLSTPFVSNEASYRGVKPKRPSGGSLGPYLRAAMWNIERGSEFDLIRHSFSDPEALERAVGERVAHTPAALDHIRAEAHLLKDSDLLVLNEVDVGMTRTYYRDVAQELARALDMNYAFGVEFVEVDKIELGTGELEAPDKESVRLMRRDFAVERERYRGLHGTAVLSRYPILSARIHRLKVCYDWFGKERAGVARLESGRRMAASKLFLERIGREVRHGGRIALIVDLAVPDSPTGLITVVAPHLENKCPAKCRQEQMRDLLRQIEPVRNPVILAGDLNTTGSDGAPMSIRREIAKRVRNPKFWAGQAINWLNPVNLPMYVMMPSNYFRSFLDPTARHVPFFAPNRESGLFRSVEKFRFADGRAFDFRGTPNRTTNGRGNTLGNSNQRAVKGFTSTFAFKRDFAGLAGRFKLDWFLVKPCVTHPRDPNGSHWLAPHNGRTLRRLNEAVPEQISDHHPITVDLPLTQLDQEGELCR